MTFRSGSAAVAFRPEPKLGSRRAATAASHFPFTMTKSMTARRSPSGRCRLAPGDRLVSVIRRPRCRPWGRAGGGERNRTDDLLLAKQALSRLSYTPRPEPGFRAAETGSSPTVPNPALRMVGLGRLELPTSRLSGVRSNRLSYRPVLSACRSRPVAARMPRKGVSAACAGRVPRRKLLSRTWKGYTGGGARRCKAIRNFLAETPESLERR